MIHPYPRRGAGSAALSTMAARAFAVLLPLAFASAQANVGISSPTSGQVFANQTTISVQGTSVTGPARCRLVSIYLIVDGGEERFCQSVNSGTVGYGCSATVGVGGHTVRARQRVSDVRCGTGSVSTFESSTVPFTVARVPTVDIAIQSPAPNASVAGNRVTTTSTASSTVLGGLQGGETLTVEHTLDGLRVGGRSATSAPLQYSLSLVLEHGRHTLKAVGTYLDPGLQVAARKEVTSTFDVVQPVPTLVTLGHGPGTGAWEQRALRYDVRAGAYAGFFGSACHALDMTFGPDGRYYQLDAASFHEPFFCTAPAAVERFDGQSGQFDPDDEHAYFLPWDQYLGLARALTFGPDGHLYVVTSGYGPNTYGNVLRYQGPFGAQPGEFIDVFVPADGRFYDAQKLRFGPDGALYVADSASHRVLRYQGPAGTQPGRYVDDFVPSNGGGLSRPTDLAFAADGSLYVVSAGNARLLQFAGPRAANAGTLLRQIPQVALPEGLAIGPGGDLFVSAVTAELQGIFRYDGITGQSKGQFATVRYPDHAGSGPGALAFSTLPTPPTGLGDLNRDGCVNAADLALLMAAIGSRSSPAGYDLNGDGRVDISDARKLVALYTVGACP